jgi:hypothetical protein
LLGPLRPEKAGGRRSAVAETSPAATTKRLD